MNFRLYTQHVDIVAFGLIAPSHPVLLKKKSLQSSKPLSHHFISCVTSSTCLRIRFSSRQPLCSVLYGAEFLDNPWVCLQFESPFSLGVWKLYGFPSGVSNVAVCFLFPDVCILSLIICRKFSVLLQVFCSGETFFSAGRSVWLWQIPIQPFVCFCFYYYFLRCWLQFACASSLFHCEGVCKWDVHCGIREYSEKEVELAWRWFPMLTFSGCLFLFWFCCPVLSSCLFIFVARLVVCCF